MDWKQEAAVVGWLAAIHEEAKETNRLLSQIAANTAPGVIPASSAIGYGPS